jgi:hypothetical protein
VTGYDRDVRRSDGRPARLTRPIGVALAIVAFTVLLGATPPQAAAPGSILQLVDAPAQGAGSKVLDVFGILLFAGLGLAILVAVGAGIVLFRTRGVARAVPPPSEGWWTCANCGAGNMDGAARCHNCSTWRAAPSPRPTSTVP